LCGTARELHQLSMDLEQKKNIIILILFQKKKKKKQKNLGVDLGNMKTENKKKNLGKKKYKCFNMN